MFVSKGVFTSIKKNAIPNQVWQYRRTPPQRLARDFETQGNGQRGAYWGHANLDNPTIAEK
jgi:hypothetical protein